MALLSIQHKRKTFVKTARNRKNLISDLIQTAHEAGAKRLVNASSGNMNMRYSDIDIEELIKNYG